MPFALDHVTIVLSPYATFYGTPADAAKVIDALPSAIEEIRDADGAEIIAADEDGITRLRPGPSPKLRSITEKLLGAHNARNGGRGRALLNLIANLNP
jgi:hypothetical protein